MTDDAAEVRRLLAPLRDRPVSVDQHAHQVRRTRVVSVLKQELATHAAARVVRPWRRAAIAALTFAAAAAVLVLSFVWPTKRAPEVRPGLIFVGSFGDTVAFGDAAPRNLLAGETLIRDPGEIQTSLQGSAELVTSAGLGLTLSGATRLSVSDLVDAAKGNQVELRRGACAAVFPTCTRANIFR